MGVVSIILANFLKNIEVVDVTYFLLTDTESENDDRFTSFFYSTLNNVRSISTTEYSWRVFPCVL